MKNYKKIDKLISIRINNLILLNNQLKNNGDLKTYRNNCFIIIGLNDIKRLIKKIIDYNNMYIKSNYKKEKYYFIRKGEIEGLKLLLE